MSTPRTSIIAGPARITFRGRTLFSRDDVVVSTQVRAFEVAASGRAAQRREDRVDLDLTFTPDGAWTPMCALLQELAGLAVGQDVFGVEAALIVDSADGWTYTYANGALTGPPPVVFSGGRTLFGPATFTALGARDTAPTAADRRVVIVRTEDPAAGDYDDSAARVVQPYTLSWGSSATWANLAVADGVSLAFDLKLTPRATDAAGVVGWRVASFAVTARARPLGVADADVLAATGIQGRGAGRGRTLGGPGAPDLVVAGAGVFARINAAGLDASRSEFGATQNRVGELGWTASVTPTAADGPWRPLFVLGI